MARLLMADAQDPQDAFGVELLLTEAVGRSWSASLPALYVRLHGMVGGPSRDGGIISVLAAGSHGAVRAGHGSQPRTWTERTAEVSAAQLRRLLDALRAIGFPTRVPNLRAVVDTSIGHTTVTFHARVNEQSWGFTVSMLLSGFEGADADGVREMCRELFALAEYDSYDPVVYGTPDGCAPSDWAEQRPAEALRRSNEQARALAATIVSEGLPCPHCRRHTKNVRFVEPSQSDELYFICGECGRSFAPADLEQPS